MSKTTVVFGRLVFCLVVALGGAWSAPSWAGCIPVTEIVNNGIDEDCDGVDSCYQDVDNDNFGTPIIIDSSDLDCADAFEAGVSGDCNDGNANIHPGATEIVGDNIDEDCNGQERCYQDNDNDDYGTSTQINSSDADCIDALEATVSGDCNDGNANIHPGATEIVGDNIDEDCNGQERCYQDNDNDDYGTSIQINSTDVDCIDALEATVSGDCNDGNASIHPGATEIVADNIDEDCNGQERCYQDNDNDDYGTSIQINSTDVDCLDAFEATNTTDCNDGSAAVHPGAAEIVADNIDEDCNGQERCYQDNDNDDYGTSIQINSTDVDCLDAFEATNTTDCNDGNASINPGASEVCNNQDDDCDTVSDDFTPPAAVTNLTLITLPSFTSIAWSAVPGLPPMYDLVRGKLSTLASSGGNFTIATDHCTANDHGSTFISDTAVPPTGDGYWFLVRGVICITPGTYDSGALSQVGLRDAEIAASPLSCP